MKTDLSFMSKQSTVIHVRDDGEGDEIRTDCELLQLGKSVAEVSSNSPVNKMRSISVIMPSR